jgi:hypothetical protein
MTENTDGRSYRDNVPYKPAAAADVDRMERLGTTLISFARDQGMPVATAVEMVVYEILRTVRPDLFEDFSGQGKYGMPEALTAKLHPGEPWFAVLGRDALAVGALLLYAGALAEHHLPEQAQDVSENVVKRFIDWQRANRDKVKMPD